MKPIELLNRLQFQNLYVMKNKFAFSFAILSMFLVQTSCNEIEKLKDALFDVSLEQEFVVATDTSKYAGVELIDPTTNKDFNDNKDKISNLEISRISYQIITLDTLNDAATKLLHGHIAFERFDGTNRTDLAEMENVDLKSAFRSNVETPITLKPGSADKLTEIFSLAPYKARILYNAEADKPKANFRILFRYKLRLKAKL